MRALVVYESMFGNTQAIAKAVAEGLLTGAEVGGVRVVEVSDAPPQVGDDVDLLVVGAPTHAFSLSRPSSRRDALTRGQRPLVSTGIGVREWLDELTLEGPPPLAAAFDTRVDRPRLPGSAARAAARRLRRLGMRLVLDPTTFRVRGMEGPLVEGEVERARLWGRRLVARVERPATAGR